MNCGTERGWNAHKSANEPACQYCKSWKAKHDAGLVKVAPINSKRELAKCGTAAAYERHRRNGEAACKPCRDARNQYVAQKKTERQGSKTNSTKPAAVRTEIKCGTNPGYYKHEREKTRACKPCMEAHGEYRRNLYATKNQGKKKYAKVAPCGTVAGYLRHLRDQGAEGVCADCRAANSRSSAERRARKKAEAK